MLITTDASIFEIEPKDVIYPVNRDDLVNIIRRLLSEQQSFTMRAGGTSIGGQAIGDGILVDISKHLTNIIDFSEEKKLVVVEPGVIQDDLNNYLKPFHLKFAPDTSTSNRAMIGGMIGNNSCGAYSVFYGTTRDHVKSVEVILSDGSLVVFEEIDESELEQKVKLQTLEGDIYRFITNLLTENQTEILDAFPDANILNNGSVLLDYNSPKPPKERIGMSYDRLNSSRNVLKIAIGQSKQQAVNLWIEGKKLPISEVHGDNEKVYLSLDSIPEVYRPYIQFNPVQI